MQKINDIYEAKEFLQNDIKIKGEGAHHKKRINQALQISIDITDKNIFEAAFASTKVNEIRDFIKYLSNKNSLIAKSMESTEKLVLDKLGSSDVLLIHPDDVYGLRIVKDFIDNIARLVQVTPYKLSIQRYEIAPDVKIYAVERIKSILFDQSIRFDIAREYTREVMGVYSSDRFFNLFKDVVKGYVDKDLYENLIYFFKYYFIHNSGSVHNRICFYDREKMQGEEITWDTQQVVSLIKFLQIKIPGNRFHTNNGKTFSLDEIEALNKFHRILGTATYTLRIETDYKRIASVYNNGPRSCMKRKYAGMKIFDTEVRLNPAAIYGLSADNVGLIVGYNNYSRPVGRAVINLDTKKYLRAYGPSAFIQQIQGLGYEQSDNALRNCRFPMVYSTYNPNHLIFPYLDGVRILSYDYSDPEYPIRVGTGYDSDSIITISSAASTSGICLINAYHCYHCNEKYFMPHITAFINKDKDKYFICRDCAEDRGYEQTENGIYYENIKRASKGNNSTGVGSGEELNQDQGVLAF
jgi:hypothetical protein